jgi:cytochrome P450
MHRREDDLLPRCPFHGDTALEAPGEWAALGQRCPLARVRLPSGDEATLLTRHEDVRRLLSDTRFGNVLRADGTARLADEEAGGVFGSDMAMAIPAHGSEHARGRRTVSRWFTAERMAAQQPGIEAVAEKLVDDMVSHGHPADLRAHLAFPLPVWVICDLFGVPAADHDRFAYWSDVMLNLTRPGRDRAGAGRLRRLHGRAGVRQAHRPQRRPAQRSGDRVRRRRTAPVRTGTGLHRPGPADRRARDHHQLIGTMVALLLADRRRWERLLADPSLVPLAVEEALRFDAEPGIGVPRYLDRPAEAAGALRSSRNPHLAFGAGPYACLGRELARTELRTVLHVLLRRLPSLELAAPTADLRRLEGLAVGGLSEVPVRW